MSYLLSQACRPASATPKSQPTQGVVHVSISFSPVSYGASGNQTVARGGSPISRHFERLVLVFANGLSRYVPLGLCCNYGPALVRSIPALTVVAAAVSVTIDGWESADEAMGHKRRTRGRHKVSFAWKQTRIVAMYLVLLRCVECLFLRRALALEAASVHYFQRTKTKGLGCLTL